MKKITKKMPKAQVGKIVKTAVKSVKPATNIAKDLPIVLNRMNRAELKNILKGIEKDLPKPTGLGPKKNGGPIKKLKKAELGMATEESCGPGRPKCGKTKTIRGGKTKRFKTGPAPGRTWMSSMAKGGSVAKKKK
jgi:hypothetical protein